MRCPSLSPVALCFFLLAAVAHAQSESAGASPDIHQPTVLSVLTLAKDMAETGRNEAVRLPLRYRVARAMQKAGQEDAFGDYVATALGAWDTWDPRRDAPDRVALRTRLQAVADAKRAFLAGDLDGATRLLSEPNCYKSSVVSMCLSPNIDMQFLDWELEAGNPSAAARQFRDSRLARKEYQAERIVRAFIAAGWSDEGFALLSEIASDAGADPVVVARAYWRLGVRDQGMALMRTTVTAALDVAAREPGKPLPVGLAGVQLAMGDREGSLKTLHRIQQFDVRRIAQVRTQLAGQLAFAGFDADALALAKDTPAERPTLAAVVTGQARRGDFAAAFDTLSRLRDIPLPASPIPASPSGFPPPDENSVVKEAASAIARDAARRGEIDSFRRAFAIRQELEQAHPMLRGGSCSQ
jgi:hypothetical protein